MGLSGCRRAGGRTRRRGAGRPRARGGAGSPGAGRPPSAGSALSGPRAQQVLVDDVGEAARPRRPSTRAPLARGAGRRASPSHRAVNSQPRPYGSATRRSRPERRRVLAATSGRCAREDEGEVDAADREDDRRADVALHGEEGEALDLADEPGEERVDAEVAQAVVAHVEPHVVVGVVEPPRHRHAVHHRRRGTRRGRRPGGPARAPRRRRPRGRARRSGGRRGRSAGRATRSTARRSAGATPRRTARATRAGTGSARRRGAPRGSRAGRGRTGGRRTCTARLPRSALERARLLRKGATWQDLTCSSRRKGQRTGVVPGGAQRAFGGAGLGASMRSPPSAIVTPSPGVAKAWSSARPPRVAASGGSELARHAARDRDARRRASRARARCS